MFVEISMMLLVRRCARLVFYQLITFLVIFFQLRSHVVVTFCMHVSTLVELNKSIVKINFKVTVICRDHSFPRAAEFRAEPQNLAVAAEFPCFRGISRNSRKFRGTTKFCNSVLLL